MFATGVTMGLAEWIIDDTCLVINSFHLYLDMCSYIGAKVLKLNVGVTD